MARDDKDARLGMMAFSRFMLIGMHAKEAPDWSAFEGSKFYLAFVRFGRFVGDMNAINPPQLVDFLIKTGVPVDRWRDMPVYETYLRDLTRSESPCAALERNFLLMQDWSRETGESFVDFFRKVAPQKAVRWVVAGRISPWVLFTASSAADLFERLTPEQTSIVEKAVDPEMWARLFDERKEDVRVIRDELNEAGL